MRERTESPHCQPGQRDCWLVILEATLSRSL